MAESLPNLSSNIDAFHEKIKSTIGEYESRLDLMATYDYVDMAYGDSISEAQELKAALGDKYNELQNAWESIIRLADDKYDFEEQGDIGVMSLNNIDILPQREQNYTADIVPVKDKNLDEFEFLPLSSYEKPLWTDYTTTSSDLLSSVTSSVVAKQTYLDYVFRNELSARQELADGIDAGNAAIGSKGFTFPNSEASSNKQILLLKYLKEINEVARKIWEEVASKVDAYLEQSIQNILSRIDGNISFNRDHVKLSKQFADAFSQIRGIMNDINISKYSLTEEQAQQNIKNTVTILVSLYKSYIQSETILFETNAKRILALWDREVQEIKVEFESVSANIKNASAEYAFYTDQFTSKIKAVYDGLAGDISSYETSFAKNASGLVKGFSELAEAMRQAQKSVSAITIKSQNQ